MSPTCMCVKTVTTWWKKLSFTITSNTRTQYDKEERQMTGGSINQVARANHIGSYMRAIHWDAEVVPQLQPWGQGYSQWKRQW